VLFRSVTGLSIGMGKNQTILVTLEGPNQSSDQLRHDRVAGDYNLVGLELGDFSGRNLTETRGKLLQTKVRLEQQPSAGAPKEQVIGDILRALAYWTELNLYTQVSGDLHRIVPLRLPSEALSTSAAKITRFFDAPLTAEPGGLTLEWSLSIPLGGDELSGNPPPSRAKGRPAIGGGPLARELPSTGSLTHSILRVPAPVYLVRLTGHTDAGAGHALSGKTCPRRRWRFQWMA
jgi:hypothetical protein